MDARYSEDQLALRDVTASIVADHAASTVDDLADEMRRERLHDIVREAGLYDLRAPEAIAEGATSVDPAIVLEELAGGAAEVAYLGPVLACDLLRRAGVGFDAVDPHRTTIALSPDLRSVARVDTSSHGVAFDAVANGSALALQPVDDGWRLVRFDVAESACDLDLTRACGYVEFDAAHDVLGTVGPDLDGWRTFALAMCASDLVGTARGAHQMGLGYSRDRSQYGRLVGSFQAVQHLLADSLVLLEGAISAARYASWAADAEDLEIAAEAAIVAKAYCSSAARQICEINIQIHGGIGNTWECMAHVFLRRALLVCQILGDDVDLVDELALRRQGECRGLSG